MSVGMMRVRVVIASGGESRNCEYACQKGCRAEDAQGMFHDGIRYVDGKTNLMSICARQPGGVSDVHLRSRHRLRRQQDARQPLPPTNQC